MSPENTTQAATSVASQPPQATTSPNYREIMNQILGELGKRKGLLFKRVLLTTAPIILALLLAYISSWLGGSGDGVPEDPTPVQTGLLLSSGALFLLVTPVWTVVIGGIFKTERTIWIDAFFDNVTLSSKESWKIATKLFWPSVWLRFSIFFRYYAGPLAIALAVIGIGIYAAIQLESALIALFAIVIALVGLIVYAYVAEIKLRYVWFVFIDLYGSPEFTHGRVFTQMKEFNRQVKQGDIKKLVLTTLGVDATGAAANAAIQGVSGGLSLLGNGGKAAGQLVSLVGGTMVEVARDYAKQVSYYMFYRLARQALYGADDKGSVSLYASHGIGRVEN